MHKNSCSTSSHVPLHKGCAWQGGGTDPWETGSYDLALEEAHIEDFNVVAYTSVIPPGVSLNACCIPLSILRVLFPRCQQ